MPHLTQPIAPPPKPLKRLRPRVRTVAEADRALTEAFGPWAARLSVEEAEVLADYKGSGFRLMNKALRGDIDIAAVRRRAGVLAEAVRRARMPFAIRVWRGIGSDELRAVFGEKQVCDTVSNPGLVSVSLSEDKAESFDSGMVLEIVLRRGQQAAYIHPFPTPQMEEYEVLMAPGTRLTILERTEHRILLEATSGSTAARR